MDDAVLSAGSRIIQLKETHEQVQVITIFTKFVNGSTTWDSKKYLIKSHALNTTLFEKKRIEEDIRAMNRLRVDFLHLSYIDAGFRKTAKNNHAYSNYSELFSGNLNPDDVLLMEKISNDIKSRIHPADIIYAPVAIGKHADHILINRIAKTLPNKTYFWLDQPYAYDHNETPKKNYRKALTIPFTPEKKMVFSEYRSQVKQLYPHGIPHIDELFYTLPSIRK
jgi:hypothetical protein